jgi:eukaryotic-like serine/threonine-protein kinase
VSLVSHYRLGEEIGRGGMGVVYRATDTRLGRAVAIKTLSPDTAVDPNRFRRFLQEARAASALNHPNIVTIHDIEQRDGDTFIVMELVEGEPLDRIIARGPLPVSSVLDYSLQIASALEAAHAGGIVHRDIKPANVIVTGAGLVKLLDFGVAKLFEHAPSAETMTALATGRATAIGTPAYMSPEQAEGRVVDGRSDIFALGCVIYEMLTGRRPFSGESSFALISAILRDRPPPLRAARPDAPRALQGITDRALAKDPADRYPTAGHLRSNLDSLRRRLATGERVWRRPAVVIPVLLLLLAASAFGAWQTVQARRVTWARQQALPEIERLHATEHYVQAVRRAREVARYAPAEIAALRQGWYTPAFVVDPPDVDVAVKNYLDVAGPWELLGRLPLSNGQLPFGYYRVRFTRTGYTPLEISSPAMGRRFSLRLGRTGEAPPNMVYVGGGPAAVGVAKPVELPDFWLDTHEVSNAEFQRFVDAGGYRDQTHWKEPFIFEGQEMDFDAAMTRFRDATGRPGPAGWELGRFPDGEHDLPVGGISWFEAAAFAEFSEKRLPSIYHWFHAANIGELSADILRLSNVDGTGPRRVGESGGLGPFGTLDMAGNVAEWCMNQVDGSSMRYILGGSWEDPAYRYLDPDGQDPWSRSARFGVRLVRNLGAAESADLPVGRVHGDPKTVVPAPKALVDVYRRFYAYDRTPLDARVDSVDDSSPFWRKERVTLDAPYGRERLPVNVFLPKYASPPYQAVIVFPSAYALFARSSELLDYSRFDFIMRSGRAAIYPVYQGTYERGGAPIAGPSERRDWHVQMAKDLFRAVDYLETRSDIDMQKLGYYSLSMGAYFAPIPLALDSRIKAAVIASGGLRFNYPPEIQPANFAPDVRVPVLLISGKNDFQTPPAVQERLVELLGTPAEHKKWVVLEGGHVPNDYRGLVREALDWYDTYLGPVQ